jgi:4-aminobutyrate aminotransferase-like enzyme
LESDADGKEILSGISGVGALAVGKLKNRVAAELIRRAAEQPKGTFDYRVAFEIAKKMVTEKPEKRRTKEAEPQKYWLP